jgi:hypothetical protein
MASSVRSTSNEVVSRPRTVKLAAQFFRVVAARATSAMSVFHGQVLTRRQSGRSLRTALFDNDAKTTARR